MTSSPPLEKCEKLPFTYVSIMTDRGFVRRLGNVFRDKEWRKLKRHKIAVSKNLKDSDLDLEKQC